MVSVKKLLLAVFGLQESVSIPVSLGAILDYCGLGLRVGTFQGNNIHGAYSRTDRAIYISERLSQERRNFTIAHEIEIGHHRLHNNIPTDIFYFGYTRYLKEPDVENVEAAANEFASCLLMPRETVLELWPVAADMRRTANMFGVSQAAASQRLKDLNYFGPESRGHRS